MLKCRAAQVNYPPLHRDHSSGTPLARSGHTIVAANEKAYLFGGCGIEEGAMVPGTLRLG